MYETERKQFLIFLNTSNHNTKNIKKNSAESNKGINAIQQCFVECLKCPCGIHVGVFESYGTAKKKRPGYLVGNLVATNWPIEKALNAIGYNQIPTK